MQYSCFCFGQAEHAEFQNARYIGLFGGQRVGNIYAWKNFCVIGNFFCLYGFRPFDTRILYEL